MAIYDPNPQPEWTPPAPQPGYTTVPADVQPASGGDRWALIALAVSLTVLLSCIPGLNCLAFMAPLVVGIIALVQAKNAVNPSRARLYGWIATAIGIVLLLVVVGIVIVYGAVVARMISDPSFQEFSP